MNCKVLVHISDTVLLCQQHFKNINQLTKIVSFKYMLMLLPQKTVFSKAVTWSGSSEILRCYLAFIKYLLISMNSVCLSCFCRITETGCVLPDSSSHLLHHIFSFSLTYLNFPPLCILMRCLMSRNSHRGYRECYYCDVWVVALFLCLDLCFVIGIEEQTHSTL